MQKANSPPDIWQILFFFLIALLVVIFDQFTKTCIRTNLVPGQSMAVTDWLRLTYAQNSGSAFGLFPNQSLILTIVALVGIAFIITVTFSVYRWLPLLNNNLSRLALGLMLGGTTGNVIDRIRIGYVTDFIDFGFWPAFNVADSAIVCGTLLIVYLLLSTISADTQRPTNRNRRRKTTN